MPVMLPEEAWDRWLDPGRLEGEALAELKGLLVPSEEDWLELYPVSRRVNDVRNDGPDLVERIPEGEVARGGEPTSDPPESRSGGRSPRSAAPAPMTRGLFDLDADDAEDDTPG